MAELATAITSDEAARLNQAEGVVRAFCGWHIAPLRTNGTYRLLTPPSHVIALPTLHLVSVETIDDGSGVTYVEDVDYTASDAGVLTRLFGCWPTGTTVTFTHGYTVVPPEVTGVVQAIAQRAVANPGSVVETQTGPFANTYGPKSAEPIVLALTAGERSALAEYRIPVQ